MEEKVRRIIIICRNHCKYQASNNVLTGVKTSPHPFCPVAAGEVAFGEALRQWHGKGCSWLQSCNTCCWGSEGVGVVQFRISTNLSVALTTKGSL